MRHISITCLCLVLAACQPSPAQLTATFEEKQAQTQAAAPTATITPSLTPSPTNTLTPIPTVTPFGGGSGQLIFGAARCQTTPCEFFVYKHEIQSRRTSLLFEDYNLLGISPNGDKLIVNHLAQVKPERSELFIVDLDGSNPVLLHSDFYGSAPGWLPGTDWIAFVAFVDRKPQVFVIHSDGTELTQITNSKTGVLAVLPLFDGGIYWEEGYDNRSGSHSHGYNWTIFDGSETKDLDHWIKPAISNNGASVAYLAHITDCSGRPVMSFGCTLTISRLDGSEAVTIPVENLKLPEGLFASFARVSWLPDDEGIITGVSICDPDCSYRYFLISRQGEVLKELPSGVLPNIAGMGPWQWSPDETTFIFSAFEAADASYRILYKLYEMENDRVQELEFGLEPDWEVRNVFWLAKTP